VGHRRPARGPACPTLLPGALAFLPPTTPIPKEGAVTENDHPRGALLFMLIYLVLLALLWTNAYLKLWTG
jgi:hypothetical protein